MLTLLSVRMVWANTSDQNNKLVAAVLGGGYNCNHSSLRGGRKKCVELVSRESWQSWLILDDYSRSVRLGSIVGRGPVGCYWSLNLSSIHCFICLVLSKSLYAGNCQSSQEYNHIIILSSGVLTKSVWKRNKENITGD